MPAATAPSSTEPDDARISGLATMLALGGHAAVILAAFLLMGRQAEVVVPSHVVKVTLVGGGGGSPQAQHPSPASARAANQDPPSRPSSDDASSGERLDQLTAALPAPASEASASAAQTRSSSAAAKGGRSLPGQGLGPGEGAAGVDLYASASLPDVGARPRDPPPGDLWSRIKPCWRSAVARQATLLVSLGPDGALTAPPQAVRRQDAKADAQAQLAERAATRAVQACAPYGGVEAKAWRVEFP